MGDYKYGFSNDDSASNYALQERARASTSRRRPRRSRRTRTSRSGCSTCASRRTSTSSTARCPSGARDLSTIDFDNIYYYIKPTESQAKQLGGPARPTSRTPGTAWASRRPSASSSPASARSTRAKSSTTSCARTSRSRACIFLDMDSALREHPEIVREYFGTIIPHNDNKFAALNSAVWSGGSFIYVPAGREGRDAAAGVLPHQRREHGPVRAHADHRRRGRVRALRRGLHRADRTRPTRCTARSSRSSSRRAAAAATRRSRTGRPTSTTSSPSAPSRTRTRRWSGSTATSAPRSR